MFTLPHGKPLTTLPQSWIPTPQIGIANSASIEGTAPVGGIPPTVAAGGGTAVIRPPATVATVTAFWLYVGAIGALVVFWCVGAFK
jgi:hypothetical protein